MDSGDRLWQEAAAGVQSSMDADLRDEAYEVFVAEAARCRLVDRAGPARVSLRCGVTLEGDLQPDSDEAIDGHLGLQGTDGRTWHIPVPAVLRLTGTRPGLRVEGEQVLRSLASWLREAWSADEPVRVLDTAGRWSVGRVEYVGADHVELGSGQARMVVPVLAVEAWQRG